MIVGSVVSLTSLATTQGAASLPGKGLAEHDFLYAGEAKEENLYLVKDGRIAWSYTHPGRGEISDALLLPKTNILFARQYGIAEVTAEKKIVWVLRSWTPPEDLGPSTTLQLLDEHAGP